MQKRDKSAHRHKAYDSLVVLMIPAGSGWALAARMA